MDDECHILVLAEQERMPYRNIPSKWMLCDQTNSAHGSTCCFVVCDGVRKECDSAERQRRDAKGEVGNTLCRADAARFTDQRVGW